MRQRPRSGSTSSTCEPCNPAEINVWILIVLAAAIAVVYIWSEKDE